jgi:hypothetical protein
VDFSQEAVGSQAGRELRMQDLQRNQAVVLEVTGEIDRGHAPTTELALNSVCLSQRSLETRLQFG